MITREVDRLGDALIVGMDSSRCPLLSLSEIEALLIDEHYDGLIAPGDCDRVGERLCKGGAVDRRIGLRYGALPPPHIPRDGRKSSWSFINAMSGDTTRVSPSIIKAGSW